MTMKLKIHFKMYIFKTFWIVLLTVFMIHNMGYFYEWYW